MRYYIGQRFVAEVAGQKTAYTTREQYAGGPVVAAAGEVVMPTHIVETMLALGVAVPIHSCLVDGDSSMPAYLRAERCAKCQHVAGLAPGSLAAEVLQTAAGK